MGTIQVSQETTKGLGSLHELTFWEILLLRGQCPPWKSFSPWLRDRKSTDLTPATLYLRSQNELVDQFSSVTQSCPTLCDPIDCSTPGLPVHHQHLELAQAQVHRVSDAIQPSHPLSSPSPPAFNLSQHQDLIQWVSSSHQLAKVLEFQLQHLSFQWIFRTDFF